MSAAVAYYAVLSMFPLLLILTSGLGVFLKWTNAGQDAQHYILNAIGEQLSPGLAENVRTALEQVQQHASFHGPVGFATLLIAAMAMFAQFERAFDRIWNVKSPINRTFWQTALRVLTHRLRAFIMLVSLGVAVIAVFLAGIAFEAFRAHVHERISGIVWFWWLAQMFVVVSLNAIVFALLYKFLPKMPVRWIHALRGGLFAAICWEIGRQILAAFVIGQRYSNAYGLIGSLLAIMLWAYYSFAVVFIGAEYVQLLDEESSVSSGLPSAKGNRRKSFPGEATTGLLLAYVGLFLAARHFWSYDIPPTPTSPQASAVIFSRTPDGQQWGKFLFSPLIVSLPGNYWYPNGVDLPPILETLQAAETVNIGVNIGNSKQTESR